ncbi:hypothetical protein M9Y82_04790 [Leptospira weilii]|uniref:Uncharacterized protein n=1 Tax=Leptospira weilii str. 2006001855 TaxID=996804 RepID=M6FXY0_9LEPT|nr:hypothetical protein [Leptospira weilii]EMM74989.1 hypothetical protein LEP1GSC038_0862 [Leptospira weilii str. 2006001855]MCL8265978.1 hypothetical protein [Leptospira weilii]
MIKDDNSHGEGRDLGMDELQFDDIDSMLASESSSEPSGLEDLSIDSLESLVASSGEEYPSSFENDFYFHPEEIDSGSSDPSLEDPMDLELTDPIVDVEIEKLLDIGDFVDSSTSKTSNLESDDSFFNPGDSAPDEGMDFSELDNYLTEESDEIDFGEESDDIEEFASFDHQEKAENISSHEDDFLNEEEPIALSESELEEIVSEPLPDFILNSEEENIALSDSELDGILEGEEFPETDTRFEAPFEESEEDGSIAFSGSELDDILNTTTDESGALTNSEADDDDLPDFITHTDFDENEEPVDSSLGFEPEATSFEAEDENEPIALSDEELGNLLSSENEEPVDSSLDFEPETISFEAEDASEPIALSEDELGNLLSSENEEPVDSSLGFEPEATSFEAEDASEPIALSDEELGNLLSSENEEPVDSSLGFEPEATSFEAEDANEPIALSEDELGNLLSSENEEPVDSSLGFEPEDESEPIALSEDELGNLLSSENEEPVDSSLGFEPEATSFEAEDANEPIALSEDELGNLLSSENEEPVDSSLGFEPEAISFEAEDENEPIALSEDELGNLLSEDSGMETSTKTDGFEDLLGDGELPEDTGSMFEENEPFSLPDLGGPDEFGLEEETLSDSSTDFEPNESFMEPGGEDEEAIALSEEELGNLLSSDEKETPSSSLFDETSSQEEDSISLPVRELDAIPSPQEDSLALENFELSTDDFDTLQTQTTTSFEAEDTNEPIALSEDELDHILTDDEEPNVSENTLEKFPGSELDWDFPVSEQTEEDEGPIALSEDELGNLLEDAPATIKEEDLNEILGELPPTSDLDAFDSIDDNVSKEKVPPPQVAATEDGLNQDEMIIVLDEYADEEKSSPIEELRKTPDQEEKEDASGTPSKEEMKRIMTYLDELLGNLPDDLIREFSRSDYFELYKKLMKQIGV